MIYDLFRWLCIITAYPFWLLFFKAKVFYQSPNAKRLIRGGALIISNHFNVMDYMLNMFLLLPRKLYVVASEFAYRNALISFGMRFFGGIQANRNTKNLHFIDISADLIRKGSLVQIFPEGKNTDDGTMKPFKPTYLMIAMRSGMPIIPIITDGNYGLFKRTHLIIGDPVFPDEIETGEENTKLRLAEMNEILYKRCLALQDELFRQIDAAKGVRS